MPFLPGNVLAQFVLQQKRYRRRQEQSLVALALLERYSLRSRGIRPGLRDASVGYNDCARSRARPRQFSKTLNEIRLGQKPRWRRWMILGNIVTGLDDLKLFYYGPRGTRQSRFGRSITNRRSAPGRFRFAFPFCRQRAAGTGDEGPTRIVFRWYSFIFPPGAPFVCCLGQRFARAGRQLRKRQEVIRWFWSRHEETFPSPDQLPFFANTVRTLGSVLLKTAAIVRRRACCWTLTTGIHTVRDALSTMLLFPRRKILRFIRARESLPTPLSTCNRQDPVYVLEVPLGPSIPSTHRGVRPDFKFAPLIATPPPAGARGFGAGTKVSTASRPGRVQRRFR